MSMTIEEAIKHYEESERDNRIVVGICVSPMAKNHSLENAEKCRQMIEWLRELQERRKAPEIVRCGECRWYGRANKQRFYRGMDCLQRRMSIIVPDKDFCSKAERVERRTDGQNR